ncbi:MAG TPA: HAD family hydrolase [Thermodesulfovibrionales bacterium]|nr:HAD family hydrolase [Thermodesulfovibrionales bacterium]
MNIRGIIFDVNGTLIDICTDEGNEALYQIMSNFLTYQGISLSRQVLRDLYFQIMKEHRSLRGEAYPEFDAVGVFREIAASKASEFTRTLPSGKLEQLPLILAEVFRAASLCRLRLYPEVKEVLDQLRPQYRLTALSDAQRAWAIPELNAVGLLDYFSPIVISSDLGYRKPDIRIFQKALDGIGLNPSEVLFVGNDMYRDIFGAQQLGLKTVLFKSNQGDHQRNGVEADYIIYHFSELLKAIQFFKER